MDAVRTRLSVNRVYTRMGLKGTDERGHQTRAGYGPAHDSGDLDEQAGAVRGGVTNGRHLRKRLLESFVGGEYVDPASAEPLENANEKNYTIGFHI
jgi:hypothetical protein